MFRIDERYRKLARGLVSFSVALQPGERVLVNTVDIPDDMTIALLEEISNVGGIPLLRLQSNKISRAYNMLLEEGPLSDISELMLSEMQQVHAFIALRGGNNVFEQSDVAQDKKNMIDRVMRPVQDWRVKRTKWVILRWPTSGFAQQAKMSTDAFEDFFFRVCTMDYAKMEPGMLALKSRMERTDNVHITGNGTDISFSIKNIPAIPCGGHHNIPDGEVYTAPVKTSVNGVIQYNTPTVYQGLAFENVRLEFEDGRIVSAYAGNRTDEINKIFSADSGARYIGEFALGFNPYIVNPMCDILFDEKISGSFHFTPGQAYEEADNGNRSQIHWDLVCIQRQEYGGGEIYFDGELIRKDGVFVPHALQALNPENLINA